MDEDMRITTIATDVFDILLFKSKMPILQLDFFFLSEVSLLHN